MVKINIIAKIILKYKASHQLKQFKVILRFGQNRQKFRNVHFSGHNAAEKENLK